jgi:hypothetical protein
MSTLATPDNRRFLKLGDITTEIDFKDIEHLSEVQDAIKAKFGHHISAPPVDINLELDDGEALEDLDDIPSEYFLKRKDPKSKALEFNSGHLLSCLLCMRLFPRKVTAS